MAELAAAIGLLASVSSLASEGIKLSKTINLYTSQVKHASQDSKRIAGSVRSTSTLLKQLGRNLDEEKTVKVCTDEFYIDTGTCVDECRSLFEELRVALLKAAPGMPENFDDLDQIEKFIIRTRDRLTWPFKQTRIVAVGIDLERLKADLHQKITLMIHARTVREQTEAQLRRSREAQIARRNNVIEQRLAQLQIETFQLQARRAQLALQGLGGEPSRRTHKAKGKQKQRTPKLNGDEPKPADPPEDGSNRAHSDHEADADLDANLSTIPVFPGYTADEDSHMTGGEDSDSDAASSVTEKSPVDVILNSLNSGPRPTVRKTPSIRSSVDEAASLNSHDSNSELKVDPPEPNQEPGKEPDEEPKDINQVKSSNLPPPSTAPNIAINTDENSNESTAPKPKVERKISQALIPYVGKISLLTLLNQSKETPLEQGDATIGDEKPIAPVPSKPWRKGAMAALRKITILTPKTTTIPTVTNEPIKPIGTEQTRGPIEIDLNDPLSPLEDGLESRVMTPEPSRNPIESNIPHRAPVDVYPNHPYVYRPPGDLRVADQNISSMAPAFRPMTYTENSSVWNFRNHAQSCDTCGSLIQDRLESLQGRSSQIRLCELGMFYAAQITESLKSIKGKIVHLQDEAKNELQVLIPPGCGIVRDLLIGIENKRVVLDLDHAKKKSPEKKGLNELQVQEAWLICRDFEEKDESDEIVIRDWYQFKMDIPNLEKTSIVEDFIKKKKSITNYYSKLPRGANNELEQVLSSRRLSNPLGTELGSYVWLIAAMKIFPKRARGPDVRAVQVILQQWLESPNTEQSQKQDRFDPYTYAGYPPGYPPGYPIGIPPPPPQQMQQQQVQGYPPGYLPRPFPQPSQPHVTSRKPQAPQDFRTSSGLPGNAVRRERDTSKPMDKELRQQDIQKAVAQEKAKALREVELAHLKRQLEEEKGRKDRQVVAAKGGPQKLRENAAEESKRQAELKARLAAEREKALAEAELRVKLRFEEEARKKAETRRRYQPGEPIVINPGRPTRRAGYSNPAGYDSYYNSEDDYEREPYIRPDSYYYNSMNSGPYGGNPFRPPDLPSSYPPRPYPVVPYSSYTPPLGPQPPYDPPKGIPQGLSYSSQPPPPPPRGPYSAPAPYMQQQSYQASNPRPYASAPPPPPRPLDMRIYPHRDRHHEPQSGTMQSKTKGSSALDDLMSKYMRKPSFELNSRPEDLAQDGGESEFEGPYNVVREPGIAPVGPGEPIVILSSQPEGSGTRRKQRGRSSTKTSRSWRSSGSENRSEWD